MLIGEKLTRSIHASAIQMHIGGASLKFTWYLQRTPTLLHKFCTNFCTNLQSAKCPMHSTQCTQQLICAHSALRLLSACTKHSDGTHYPHQVLHALTVCTKQLVRRRSVVRLLRVRRTRSDGSHTHTRELCFTQHNSLTHTIFGIICVLRGHSTVRMSS